MAETRIAVITVSVTGSADEEAHAHGLDAIPTIIFLAAGTDAEVTIGATAATATNVYLDNANVAAKPGIVVCMAPHSIIQG